MLRTIGTLAVVALVGYVAFQLLFGVVGSLLGLLLALAWFALKVLLFVGVIYWLLTVFSPDTARRIRDSMKGTP